MLSLLTAHAAPTESPAEGSQEAAVRVVADFLHEYYKAPKNIGTSYAVLAKTADSLTLQTELRDKVCNVQVVRNSEANKYGWVVQQHACGGLLRFHEKQ